MRKQDQLQQLIYGLTANEKRYFKLQSTLGSNSKGYVQLFDILSGAEQYDAAQVSRQLGKTKATLAHSKEHLSDMLLRSLRSYNEDTFVSSHYNRALEEIELLCNKGQYNWAFALVEKSLQQALLADAFSYALLLLRWQHTIGFYTGKGSWQPAAAATEQKVLAALQNETAYMHLLYRFNYLLNEQKAMVSKNKQLTALMQLPLLAKITNAKSQSARICFHRIHAMYGLYVSLNKTKTEKHFKQALRVIEHNPAHLHSKSRVYCLLATGLAAHYNSHAQYDHAATVIQTLEHTIRTEKKFNRANLLYGLTQVAMLRIYNYSYSGQYAKAVKYSAEIQTTQKNVFNHFTTPQRFDFLFITALSHWKTRDYKAALKLSQQLMQNETSTANISVVNNRFMFLLLQYDLGNYTTLAYLLKSHRRWCTQQGINNTCTIAFGKMLDECTKAAGNKKLTSAILEKYVPVFESADGINNRIFETLELADWIKEKLN